MTEIKELVCYHGTGKKLYDSKRSDYFKIIKYNVVTEASKSRGNPKLPGSLGYGMYAYTTEDITYQIAEKFYKDPVVFEIELDLADEEILDLNDDETSEAYHVFRKKMLKSARRHREKFKVPNNKQNVFDGIVIELFISALERSQKGSNVNAVKLKTFAPMLNEKYDEYSNVHNGNEVCLRDSKIIKNVEIKE